MTGRCPIKCTLVDKVKDRYDSLLDDKFISFYTTRHGGPCQAIHDQGWKYEYRPRWRIMVNPYLTINSFQYNLADQIRYDMFE